MIGKESDFSNMCDSFAVPFEPQALEPTCTSHRHPLAYTMTAYYSPYI